MSLAVLLEYVLLYNNTLSVSSDCIRHILWNNGQPYSAIRRCKVFICYIRYTTYILDNKITFGVYRITLPIYFSGCAFLCNSIRAINTGASRFSCFNFFTSPGLSRLFSLQYLAASFA